MKNIYVYILISFLAIILVCLCGCSNNLSRTITSNVKEDLSVLSQEVANVPECAFVQDKIITISEKVQTISDACEMEKDVLSNQINKRNTFIVLLIALLSLLLYERYKTK